MGYKEALEAAGAKVLAFETFGSYQGDWFAKVEYEGKTGWVHDYYGSCSGCDSFEAEFFADDSAHEHDGKKIWPEYESLREGCAECDKYRQRLSDFGKSYLDEILTFEEALKRASENIMWDADAEEIVKFVKDNE